MLAWIGDALAPVGRFLRWIGSFLPDAPYARAIFWLLLIAIVLWLLRLLYLHFSPIRSQKRDHSTETPDDVDFAPEPAAARAWLEEADKLADEGRYQEAIHHLLIRSVEDIGRRRPRALRPAFTSRDIAASLAIPAAPRELFARIAAVVERSFFGGRAVDAQEWLTCRKAYHEFIRPKGWSR